MFDFEKLFQRLDVLLGKIKDENDLQKRDVPASAESQPMDATLTDASLSGWFKHETGELLEGFGILPEDVVLDVGCGDSPFLHFCAMQGAEVIFADIDTQKVAAQAKMLENSPARAVTPLVCDACVLPLKDATVSKIIAMELRSMSMIQSCS